MHNYPLYTHPDIKDLKQLISIRAKNSPHETAFQYLDKKLLQSVTYRQFQEDIDALGTFFYSQGLQNIKIAVLGENSYSWILTYFAAVLGSNVIVPIDKELPDAEINTLLLRCGAKALVYAESYTDTAEKMRSGKSVSQIYPMKEYSSYLDIGQKLISGGDHSFQQNEVNEEDVCSIIFTSGTTGEPKGVMLTQKNLMVDTVSACRNVWFTGASMLTLPLHHTFAFTTSILVMLVYQKTICINKSLRTFQTDMQMFKPQNMLLVPLYIETMYKNIWKTAKEQKKETALKIMIAWSNLLRKCGIDLRRKLFRSIHTQFGGNLDLIVSGGALLEQKFIDGMDDIGIQILNGYGITECSPVVAVNRNQYMKKGSVGLPISCCDIRIHNGEICVRGDLVMAGYYQDETATSEVMEDGWFRTGDLGYLDEDGFLYITGRKKNLIILSNGKNVSPEELESKILGIEHVLEVVVYSENDFITAEIYAEDETGIEDGIASLNKELPGYKRIQKVKFRKSAFEKTTTQKIKRGR